MGLFDALRKMKPGARPGEPTAPQTTLPSASNVARAASEAPSRSAGPPATVRVHDEFGRDLLIPIETWRNSMLPAALEKNFDNPDALYGLIVDALGLRLAADVTPAAAHLYAIDPNIERGAVLYSIVLLDTGHADIAERILSTWLAAHGPSGVVLTNLAKALTALHREAEAEDALWRGLQADPNQDNGLGWYAAMQKERHGPAGWSGAMERAAAIPGAWRPQLWLARLALDAKDPEKALSFYAEALAKAPRPVPTDLLQQMSGDLGGHGLLAEAVALTRSAYDAKFHGLPVGNNLIKAELELGHAPEARALVDELYQQQRRDWADNLNYWENEIKKRELAAAPRLAELRLSNYAVAGPVWLAETSPARLLFPPSSPRPAKVLFVGSTILTDASRSEGSEMPDAEGRLSRSVPLFLAENVFARLALDTTTLIPWVERGGFALMGALGSDADMLAQARACDASAVAAVYLRQTGATTTLNLRLLSASLTDSEPAATLAELTAPIDWNDVGKAAIDLSASLAAALQQHFAALQQYVAGRASSLPSPPYVLPHESDLANYLLRLEQLLAVRCAQLETASAGFLSGEREIVRGQFDLALRAPQSLPVRLILLETLRGLHKVEPGIAAEFRSQADLLQQRYPLADAALQALLASEFLHVFEP